MEPTKLSIPHDVFTEASFMRRKAQALLARVPDHSATALHLRAIECEANQIMNEIIEMEAWLNAAGLTDAPTGKCLACGGTGRIEPEYELVGLTERIVSPGCVCPMCKGDGYDHTGAQ